VERRLAVLLAPVVARVDLDAVAPGRTRRRHLRHEARQVAHVGDRGVHRVGRGGDVLGVLVLHAVPPPKSVGATLLERRRACARRRREY
jgi:hypothetical protein